MIIIMIMMKKAMMMMGRGQQSREFEIKQAYRPRNLRSQDLPKPHQSQRQVLRVKKSKLKPKSFSEEVLRINEN